MQSIRKITARTVGISKGAQGIGESYVVLGRVSRAIPEQGDYGDFIRLKGQFKAVNEQTGEEFRAPVCMTPGGLLEDEIATALVGEDGAESVDFGARFYLEKADNATGCEWKAEMLTEPASDDPVERLAAGLADRVPALAGPAKSGGGKSGKSGKTDQSESQSA